MPGPDTPGVGFDTPDATGTLDPVRQRLADTAQDRVGAGLDLDVVVTAGDPVHEILDCAHRRAADLLVMGTHGATGFQRLLLGSVTEKVLRKASCAVVTVPPGAHTASAQPFTRLLAAVDFSGCSLRAVTVAAGVAAAAGARLTLVHVLEWPWHDTADTTAQGVSAAQARAAAEYRHYLEAGARERLDALANSAMTGTGVGTRVCFGRPHLEILDAASDNAADLIVLGVRGRGPVDLAFFGSTASHMVRSATCPVLTVREP
jgi:nucleotide-binding universal stress UspA family protein